MMPNTFQFAVVAVLAVAGGVVPPALGQTTSQDAGNASLTINLSSEQKHTIFQSVSKTQKNSAAPTGFRVSVGANLPEAIELSPMPDTIETLIPAAKGLQVAMIEKQVVLVDPKTKQVVAVATAEN